MPVLMRHVRSSTLNGIVVLGAVQQPHGIIAYLGAGQKADAVRVAFGSALRHLDGTRQALRATLDSGAAVTADPTDAAHFEGKNVLVAFRSGETVEALSDWLTYHATEQGADAALIYDRSAPGETGMADTLDTDLPVLAVSGDLPLGRPDGPDLRHPDTAPANPKRATPPTNPWHASLFEQGIYDHLRHRFLAKARAVAFVQIADLIVPQPDGQNVFDRAASMPDRFLPLKGIETYPWRLRQGQPAPHSDHIACRRTERRALLSWALALGDHDNPRAFWRPGQPFRIEPADMSPVTFIRAMGVSYAGVPVNRLVRKSDLREQPGLVDLMTRAFDADPIRLPAPATIPLRPTKARTTIVTAMKNEGPFILDWVAHNRAIGVDDILVFTNDCDDGTVDLLDALADAGVTRRDNPYRETGKVPQYAAFRAAEDEPLVQDADWLITLDVDEYLNIHAGEGRLTDLLDASPQAHVISIPWRMFGNADRHHFEDAPVTERFTRCAPEYAPRPLQAWAFKTIYRNAGLFRRLGVHRPKGLVKGFRDSLVWVDANGNTLPPVIWDRAWRMSKAQWGYANATLNHYAVRSAESFLVKRDRGKVNRTRREQGLAYWFRMNHNAEEDRSIQRLAPRVAREKAALLTLPGVAEAHARSVNWHESRIAELKADPDHAEIYGQITSPRMERLSRMATCFGANVHLLGPQVIPDEIAAHDPSEPFFWSVKLPPG